MPPSPSAKPRPDWSGRLRWLTASCADLALDAFVVSTPANIRYLTGFAGSAGLLVATRAEACLLVDGRYTTAAEQDVAGGRLGPATVVPVSGSYDEALADRLGRAADGAVGFEGGHVTVSRLAAWQGLMPAASWRPLEDHVERRRLIKDDWEIATLRGAAGRLSEVADGLGRLVRAGASERDVARAIDRELERVGFSAPAFETIVASGPNSALPHARPTGRRLAPGDLVVLDFGGILDGYCVDLTRMAALRPVGPDREALFLAVRDAQAAALDAVAPGRVARDVDAAARAVLEARDLGPAFVHGTGHGLGLDVHEGPRLSQAGPGTDERLAPGMVFTVEPGAYVARLGGARLEDDVLVTATGREILTTASRDLLIA